MVVGKLVRDSIKELQKPSKNPVQTRDRTVIAPAQLRWVRVRAFHENKSDGKPRPGIVISEMISEPGVWKVMGLTSKAKFEDGSPRMAVSDWQASGLPYQGYYWGPRLPILPDVDIVQTMGVITPKVAMQIIRYSVLSDEEAEKLIQAARAAHL